MLKLAIVGATGLVGKKIIDVLWEEGLLKKVELFLIASERSANRRYYFKGEEYNIIKLTEKCLKMNFDVVMFSAGDEVSKEWVKKFAGAGSYVIDNTNAFRKEKNIPLVVPEINGEAVNKNEKIISNPNCSTIQLAVVIDKFIKVSEIESVVVSTYQSVSGAGRLALFDHLNGTNLFFEKGIKDNIIPQIGKISENGFCSEENKIMFELNKILNKSINVCASAVRVPVAYCHGESVYVKFKNKVDIQSLKDCLVCDYIKYSEDILLPSDIVNTNLTGVCRLRKISDTEVMLFIVADNLRRGAAYNAVGILKQLLKDKIN